MGNIKHVLQINLVKNLKNKTKKLKKWGIMRRKGVLLLNVEKFGRSLKIKQKLRENGEY